MSKAKLVIRDLSVQYRERGRTAGNVALSGVNLTVHEQEFVSLLGPSGCGKTTLLGVVAGFLAPSEGEVQLDGRPIRGPGPDRGVVFQHGALFPWQTIRQNIEYGLKLKGMPTAERRQRADELIRLVNLAGSEDKWPYQVSGGMQQRVGIARALAIDPEILLMDEPFGALDAQTRATMQNELVDIWRRTRKTVLFVTHDIMESLLLSDRVIIMSGPPGGVRAERTVSLPRPRSRTDPELLGLYEEISELMGARG